MFTVYAMVVCFAPHDPWAERSVDVCYEVASALPRKWCFKAGNALVLNRWFTSTHNEVRCQPRSPYPWQEA